MRLKLLLSLFVVAVMLVGCGGGDPSSDSAGTQSSGASRAAKIAFIRKGDAACVRNNTKMNFEAARFVEKEEKVNSSEAGVSEATVREVTAPRIARQAVLLKKIGAPPGEEEEVTAIAAAIEEGARNAERDPTSYYNEEADSAFANASKLARAYGFEVCGGE